MDTKKLTEQLKNIKPMPNLPYEIFVALRELLPMSAVELFVTRADDSFVLIKMTDQFNGWAMPGGYIGFNESFKDTCKRIANKELGVNLQSVEFAGVFNWPEGSERLAKGHAVSVLFKCKVKSKIKRGAYFNKIPKEILKHHRIMLDTVLKPKVKR